MTKGLKIYFVFLTLAIGFGCSAHHQVDHTDCPNPVNVIVLCLPDEIIRITDDDQQPEDEEICVNTDKTITWKLDNASPDGTKLTIDEFKKKNRFIGWNKNRKPLPKSSYEVDKQNPASDKVKITDEEGDALKGRFKYSVTCTFSNGEDEEKDPIIEVPK